MKIPWLTEEEQKAIEKLDDLVLRVEKNDINLHQSICNRLTEIYKAKNTDYGNSVSESYKEWGIISSVVRMDDKMRRIKQLVKHEPNVKSETIEDTLLDLANYSIMALMELRKENNSID